MSSNADGGKIQRSPPPAKVATDPTITLKLVAVERMATAIAMPSETKERGAAKSADTGQGNSHAAANRKTISGKMYLTSWCGDVTRNNTSVAAEPMTQGARQRIFGSKRPAAEDARRQPSAGSGATIKRGRQAVVSVGEHVPYPGQPCRAVDRVRW